MSLPKEPRQNMINMMYLVLTALLALNVSSEILNAFKTVNRSIDNANGTLTANNNNIYTSLAAKLADGKTKAKAEIWMPKAQQAQQIAKKSYDYIETLKAKVMEYGGFKPGSKDSLGWESNLDAATRLMDKEGNGEKVKKELENFRAQILAIDPAIAREFASKLPIDTKVPPSKTGAAKQDFTTAYFHMTPGIAAVTILNKFQNDIKNSENQVVNYCASQIDAVAVRFDKYGFVGGLNSSY